MITNRMFQPEDTPGRDEEAVLDQASEEYAELLAKARDTGKTYLVAILREEGLTAWENASDQAGIDKLKTLFAMLAMYVADQISDHEGEDACAAFFAYMVAGVLDG